MGDAEGRESCGRCSFTTVVDAVESEKGDGGGRYDPYEGQYIEVDERELKIASAPAVAAGRVKHWLDETAARFVHGR